MERVEGARQKQSIKKMAKKMLDVRSVFMKSS